MPVSKTATMTSLRGNRDFKCLLRGNFVSMVGNRATAIAFPLLILSLTQSAVVTGWATFAATVPSVIVYLPAGALVDRWDPRRAMLISEIGRGFAIAGIVVTLILGRRPVVAVLVVLAAAEKLLEVFSSLAERRFARSLVKSAQADVALARSEARAHAVVLTGRPLAGFLFGFSHILPFLADAVSFVASVQALVRIGTWRTRTRPRPATGYPRSTTRTLLMVIPPSPAQLLRRARQRATARGLRKEIRDGFFWLGEFRFAGLALYLTSGATLVSQALIMVFLGESSQKATPLTITAVLAASGAGGVLGSMIWTAISCPRRPLLKMQMWVWSVTLFTLALIGYRSTWGMAIAMAIVGFTGALGNIEFETFVNRHAETTMLGRVMSVDRLTSFVGLTLGPLIGAILFSWLGTRHAVFVLFCLTVLFLGLPAFWLSPNRRGKARSRTSETSPDDEVWDVLTSSRSGVGSQLVSAGPGDPRVLPGQSAAQQRPAAAS